MIKMKNIRIYTEEQCACKIYVNEEFCKGCGICVEFCPMNVLEISNKIKESGFPTVIPKYLNKCTICKLCELCCPDFAITVEKVN